MLSILTPVYLKITVSNYRFSIASQTQDRLSYCKKELYLPCVCISASTLLLIVNDIFGQSRWHEKIHTEISSSSRDRETNFLHVGKAFHLIRNQLSKKISHFAKRSRSRASVQSSFTEVFRVLISFTRGWNLRGSKLGNFCLISLKRRIMLL